MDENFEFEVYMTVQFNLFDTDKETIFGRYFALKKYVILNKIFKNRFLYCKILLYLYKNWYNSLILTCFIELCYKKRWFIKFKLEF